MLSSINSDSSKASWLRSPELLELELTSKTLGPEFLVGRTKEGSFFLSFSLISSPKTSISSRFREYLDLRVKLTSSEGKISPEGADSTRMGS